MKPNIELLEAVYDTIKKNKKRWRQASWGWAPRTEDKKPDPCKTAFCFAGHAVILKGAKMIWSADYGDEWDAAYCRFPHRQTEDIEGAAMRVLGLTYFQANQLFAEDNSFTDLRSILNGIEKGTIL